MYPNKNHFDLHENETACRTHFHVKGFVLRLVFKQRNKRTRKWPIWKAATRQKSQDTKKMVVNSDPWYTFHSITKTQIIVARFTRPFKRRWLVIIQDNFNIIWPRKTSINRASKIRLLSCFGMGKSTSLKFTAVTFFSLSLKSKLGMCEVWNWYHAWM